ncbi:RNA polymerase sigma factor SigJ [Gynuella sunshinyii]|uniref:DNA-directed RNA polymerase specialized sigma subunit, sigma24-like protein n=1 Tax=Gynuella sunshinyii YC6258 TaxID=1445510 RepID=A0A0C5VEK0_9GAMM|nr:RNA polymerase sigma factor SigJ [Gynuella sunshinyii]AJQ92631.1 DNA-directed RNA polymerase specialized sigma subunit, sigma24-like protein [Gynuella sunshinyii YC6258]
MDKGQLFEQHRNRLKGLAYRMLGSYADSEDAVQDTFIRWCREDVNHIENPVAWLTTVCSRICMDILKAPHNSRVDYVGPWLPEPIHTAEEHTIEEEVTLASSLSMAFLLLLERLTPKQRAAYLLKEVFNHSYTDIAVILATSESTCRKLVSRANAAIGQDNNRYQMPPERQQILLEAFHQAMNGQQLEHFTRLLAEDVQLTSDGGGKVLAALRVLSGRQRVLEFFGAIQRQGWWQQLQWQYVPINGAKGILMKHQGNIINTVTFGVNEQGQINRIFIVRNPDKLSAVQNRASLH